MNGNQGTILSWFEATPVETSRRVRRCHRALYSGFDTFPRGTQERMNRCSRCRKRSGLRCEHVRHRSSHVCSPRPDDASSSSVGRRRPRITRLDERLIVKSAPVEYLRGEANFYRAIPPELSDLFPKLVACNDDEGALLPSITITKASGCSRA